MALLEKHRIRFYEHFVEHVGEEAAEAMLAQFPSRDVDELVTKDNLAVAMANVHAEFAIVRAEIAELRVDGAKQTDRLMARMQIVAALGFAFVGMVIAFAH